MTAERLEDLEMLELLKLANRLHELPASPIVRHEHMLRELCAMTGATAGMSALLDTPPHEAANIVFLVHHGLEDAQQQWSLNRYLRALDAPLSAPAPLMRLLESRSWHPPLRLNGDEDEILRDARELCRPLNLGSAIVSTLSITSTRLISVLTLHRPLSDPQPFSPRQRRLVQLFHSEIGWTFRVQSPAEPAETSRLSPRQQQTLRHLLAGESEKQIAQKLSRSPHTVHTYVKAIYRNFRVSSRGELLSLFVR
jgi:DNA-binding CsgD family transcriptional regulator